MGFIGLLAVGLLGIKVLALRRLLVCEDGVGKSKSLVADIALLLFLATFPLVWMLPDLSAFTPNLVKLLKLNLHLLRSAAFIF